MYRSGKTFQEIGDSFGITRQRTQQITFGVIKKEIAKEKGLNYRTERENMADRRFAGKTHRLIGFISKNRGKIADEKRRKIIKSKMKLLPNYSNFFTLRDYAAAMKVNPATIRYYLPGIARKIANKKVKKIRE